MVLKTNWKNVAEGPVTLTPLSLRARHLEPVVKNKTISTVAKVSSPKMGKVIVSGMTQERAPPVRSLNKLVVSNSKKYVNLWKGRTGGFTRPKRMQNYALA